MNRAYLLTGGNLGNRAENLRQASLLIEQQAGKIAQASSLYETAAWGKTDQPDFLNQALLLETSMEPHELLETLLQIEQQLGRRREEKYGARTLDIDIIFYNDDIIDSRKLTVPHPQMQHRRFVLQPLDEIAPQMLHPVLHKTISQLLLECSDPLNVKKISA